MNLLCGVSMALETMAQGFFHYVKSYDALLMKSVEWIMGFKSSDGFILTGGKIIPLASIASSA